MNSVMMLHLEAGTCDSGVDMDEINQIAFDCRQSQSYKSNNLDFVFECPTCQTPFLFLSGLLQHAESGYCEEWLESGDPLGIFLDLVRSCESSSC